MPNPEEIVHARMTTWGQGLIELPAGRGVPEDIWEQMSLLFGELSKEDLLRQVVLSEMRKLDTGGKADLNQKDMGDRRRDRDDRYDRGGDRGGRPFRKKPFNKKFKSKGGFKSKDGFKSPDGPPSWNDSKPGKPMGAGKAKKKAKKKPYFKPGSGGAVREEEGQEGGFPQHNCISSLQCLALEDVIGIQCGASNPKIRRVGLLPVGGLRVLSSGDNHV